MKKFQYLFVLPAISLMALTSCGNNGKNPYADLPEETDASIISELTVTESLTNFANADSDTAIFGNVRLPNKVGDANVKWWSSNNKVITLKSLAMLNQVLLKEVNKILMLHQSLKSIKMVKKLNMNKQ